MTPTPVLTPIAPATRPGPNPGAESVAQPDVPFDTVLARHDHLGPSRGDLPASRRESAPQRDRTSASATSGAEIAERPVAADDRARSTGAAASAAARPTTPAVEDDLGGDPVDPAVAGTPEPIAPDVLAAIAASLAAAADAAVAATSSTADTPAPAPAPEHAATTAIAATTAAPVEAVGATASAGDVMVSARADGATPSVGTAPVTTETAPAGAAVPDVDAVRGTPVAASTHGSDVSGAARAGATGAEIAALANGREAITNGASTAPSTDIGAAATATGIDTAPLGAEGDDSTVDTDATPELTIATTEPSDAAVDATPTGAPRPAATGADTADDRSEPDEAMTEPTEAADGGIEPTADVEVPEIEAPAPSSAREQLPGASSLRSDTAAVRIERPSAATPTHVADHRAHVAASESPERALLAQAELRRVTASGRRIEIGLDTGDLGRVRIAAVDGADGLQLQLSSDQADGRQRLTQHLDELRAELDRRGVDLGSLDVSTGDGAFRAPADETAEQHDARSTLPTAAAPQAVTQRAAAALRPIPRHADGVDLRL